MMKKVTPAHDYLKHVTEFITFLSGKELTLEEILRHLVLVILSPLNAEAILIRQLNSENQAVLVETWGISLEIRQQYPVAYNLNDRYPTTDTLRNRATTFVNTLPDWGEDYPMLKNLQYTTGAKSYICIPIERTGTPVAALGVFSRDVISPNVEIEAFLKAVGSVFSMYMFRQDSKTDGAMIVQEKYMPTHVESNDNKLTERQQVILRLISEDQTNLTISELLGYSESTIRQETIKIFAKLQCDGRNEAAKIFKEMMAKSKGE
jgi:DNA-binding CsgD family transcriptional regulator